MFLCATFAYFTASVSGNDKASSIIVNTAKIGTITFADGDEVSLPDALPGASSDEKTFTIKAEGGSGFTSIPYSIQLLVTKNEITNSELEYTLTNAGTGDGMIATKTEAITATTGSQTIGSGTIAPNETHTYKFKVTFKETYSDQSTNQGASFEGKLNVVTGEGTTYYNASNPSGTTTQPSSTTE